MSQPSIEIVPPLYLLCVPFTFGSVHEGITRNNNWEQQQQQQQQQQHQHHHHHQQQLATNNNNNRRRSKWPQPRRRRPPPPPHRSVVGCGRAYVRASCFGCSCFHVPSLPGLPGLPACLPASLPVSFSNETVRERSLPLRACEGVRVSQGTQCRRVGGDHLVPLALK